MSQRQSQFRMHLITALIALMILVLPLMMGNRTPETLTTSGLLLTTGALLLAVLAIVPGPWGRTVSAPPRSWFCFAGVLTLLCVLQILPVEGLARAFGPYPPEFWQTDPMPMSWSPNPSATLRGWAVFIALLTIAWLLTRLPQRHRNWLMIAIALSALTQSLYGLISHASGSETIFGIWPRNNPDYVHGSFSNRNLYAGYLALTWPLVVAVWWSHRTPGLSRLPFELKVAGSVISGAIVGAALIGSASRLGSAAGLCGMLIALLLWARHRARLPGTALWPLYLTAAAAMIAATWYGLTPLAERLAVTTVEESRFEVFRLMLTGFDADWWLHGVGLGAFEAVFRQIQPADLPGWFDYAHNDLSQWLLETGVTGLALLLAALTALWRNARLEPELIPVYAGLGAQSLVALGDFSWHIPATQIVLAVLIGVALRKARPRRRIRRPHTVPVGTHPAEEGD